MGKKSSEYEKFGIVTGEYAVLPEGVPCLPILKGRGKQRVQIGLLPVDIHPLSGIQDLKREGRHVIIDPESYKAFTPKDPNYRTEGDVSYGEIVKAMPILSLYSRN